MNTAQHVAKTAQYARCIEASNRIQWDIDRDVIRDRTLDPAHKFLPDGLSKVDTLTFLTPGEQRMLSQIQGRTYANMFRLVERFIGAKMLEVACEHALGDQTALEAIVRFTGEELKHQELFRRIDALADAVMPRGYRFIANPDEIAAFVLSKSPWSILALTCHLEIFTQVHYRQSIAPDEHLSPLYKDVFLFHWKEESQHAIIDELEWRRADEHASEDGRDAAVDDLIVLVEAVDGVLQIQAQADTEYFINGCERALTRTEAEATASSILAAYRWQYIASGMAEPRFADLLRGLVSVPQWERINHVLASVMAEHTAPTE